MQSSYRNGSGSVTPALARERLYNRIMSMRYGLEPRPEVDEAKLFCVDMGKALTAMYRQLKSHWLFIKEEEGRNDKAV